MKRTKTWAVLLCLTMLFTLFAGAFAGASEVENFEVGLSETDEIVNTKAADKVILVASFGTSFNQTRMEDIGGIEKAIAAAYPDYQVRRAFTSQIIIDKLFGREGIRIDNITDAMTRLVIDKVKEVIIQPTTVLNGFEYDDIMDEIAPFADKFESLKVGSFLLASDEDFTAVADLIDEAVASYRAEGTAIVLMGHGTSHEANSIYTKLQDVFTEKGLTDVVIGNVEHEPTIEDVKAKLEVLGAKQVVLRPLMIVAGDHANNDMASDEEDSWKKQLEAAGYEVTTVVEGLGRLEAVQTLFVKHVEEAKTPELKVPEPEATDELTGDKVADGVYEVDVKTDSNMFKVTACKLSVESGKMTAEITMSGLGFDTVFPGMAADAEKVSEADQISAVITDEKSVFTIPVEALNKEMQLAARGKKSGKWFDHTVFLKWDNEPKAGAEVAEKAETEAKQIDVTLEGGTGRSSIDSPTTLIQNDEGTFAEVRWSSKHYTYMKIGDVEYLPTNTDGNSVFLIPVELDTKMDVIACTVAMGDPKEIEYQLTFDSATIR